MVVINQDVHHWGQFPAERSPFPPGGHFGQSLLKLPLQLTQLRQLFPLGEFVLTFGGAESPTCSKVCSETMGFPYKPWVPVFFSMVFPMSIDKARENEVGP